MVNFRVRAKRCLPFAKEKVLLGKIEEWKDYLESNLSNPPREIRNFNCSKSETIPPIPLIESILGECNIISEIMNTDPTKGTTKWRVKRNRIAHSAEGFHRRETYQEYKIKILEGIDELQIAVSQIE